MSQVIDSITINYFLFIYLLEIEKQLFCQYKIFVSNIMAFLNPFENERN